MSKNLAQWLNYIEALHPKEIDMGLERIRSLYQQLPQLPENSSIVTIAGTNGKGSTVRTLEAIGLSYGKRVGSYTSPHLLRYNERVQINQQPVSDDLLIDAFAQVDQIRGETQLTYFEFGTLAALLILAQAELDWVLLEVGLGGRLDAVNIVDPSVAVITSVDLDHESWLGNTREAIGAEKAGIIKPELIFVCGDTKPPESVKQKAAIAKAGYWAGNEFGMDAEGRFYWQHQSQQKTLSCADSLPLMSENVATALQVASVLGIAVDQQHFNKAISSMSLVGRQQLISEEPYIVLDVGHNPHAARGLVKKIQQLKSQYGIRQVHCLIGMLADKEHTNTLVELLPAIDQWWVTGLTAGTRSLASEELCLALQQAGAVVKGAYSRPEVAFKAAKASLGPKDMLVVFGSFYTVAEVLSST